MKQLALDIGLASGPTLSGFFAGPNEPVLRHLRAWVGEAPPPAGQSPVPIYLWGEGGSGKTHLLEAVRGALREQGALVGWLHAGLREPPEFDERWGAVLMDDVHLYNPVQQHAAFNGSSTRRACSAACSRRVRCRRPTCRCAKTCARGSAGATCSICSCWARPSAVPCCGRPPTPAACMLADEVLDYMLHRFSRDLGSLMELLDQLDGYALQTQRAITIPLIRSMLENQ